jgi:hypothetical protein
LCDTGIVFQVFRSPNWLTSPALQGNKHHSLQDPCRIRLSIGCREGLLPQ